MDALAEFLRLDARQAFAYGKWDCLLRLAAWAERVTGIDASIGWRQRCTTALGAARILKREGGMIALLDKVFSPLGYCRTHCPKRGDIAVVNTRQGLMGAIVIATTGSEVMASLAMPGRVRIARLPVVAAWTLGG